MAGEINNDGMAPSGNNDPFLLIPVEISEMIFTHLTIPELLSCGLVSKFWKNRSRSYLQKHRECFAYIKNPCRDLLALNNQMSRFDVSMINGIHIRNEHPDKWADIDVLDCCPVLMQFPFKYLCVDMPLEDERMCEVKLVRGLLRGTRLSLQKLSVYFGLLEKRTAFFDFLMAAGKENYFPKLAVLEGLEGFPVDSNWSDELQAIAPKLQDIFGIVPIQPLITFNASLVKCFRVVYMEIFPNFGLETNSSSDAYGRTLTAHLSNLRVFALDCHGHPPNDHRSSLELHLGIVHKHRNTLERISICPFDLLQYLKLYPSVIFPKLQSLLLVQHCEFEIDHQPYVKQGLFQHLNNPKFFPSLKEMDVRVDGLMSWETASFVGPDEEGSSVNQEPLLLILRRFDDEYDTINFLGNLSHRVTSLEVEVMDLGSYDYFEVAEAFLIFPLLEELFIRANENEDANDDMGEDLDYVMDALLCGIYIDEVKDIMEQHVSGTLNLQQLNIVPVRPPITFARNLKRLRLRDAPDNEEKRRRITDVSDCLAFSRMPELDVTIEMNVKYRDEYEDLLPFANININYVN